MANVISIMITQARVFSEGESVEDRRGAPYGRGGKGLNAPHEAVTAVRMGRKVVQEGNKASPYLQRRFLPNSPDGPGLRIRLDPSRVI